MSYCFNWKEIFKLHYKNSHSWRICLLCVIYLFWFWFFSFYSRTYTTWKSPGLGSNRSRICNLCCSLQPCRTRNLLSKARDQSHILTETRSGLQPAEPQWKVPSVDNLKHFVQFPQNTTLSIWLSNVLLTHLITRKDWLYLIVERTETRVPAVRMPTSRKPQTLHWKLRRNRRDAVFQKYPVLSGSRKKILSIITKQRYRP